jgi:hypothetical protein
VDDDCENLPLRSSRFGWESSPDYFQTDVVDRKPPRRSERETSADGSSARIQTFDQPGILTIKVSALVAPNAVATKEISVAVKRHLPVTAGVLTVTQSRNTSIHH